MLQLSERLAQYFYYFCIRRRLRFVPTSSSSSSLWTSSLLLGRRRRAKDKTRIVMTMEDKHRFLTGHDDGQGPSFSVGRGRGQRHFFYSQMAEQTTSSSWHREGLMTTMESNSNFGGGGAGRGRGQQVRNWREEEESYWSRDDHRHHRGGGRGISQQRPTDQVDHHDARGGGRGDFWWNEGGQQQHRQQHEHFYFSNQDQGSGSMVVKEGDLRVRPDPHHHHPPSASFLRPHYYNSNSRHPPPQVPQIIHGAGAYDFGFGRGFNNYGFHPNVWQQPSFPPQSLRYYNTSSSSFYNKENSQSHHHQYHQKQHASTRRSPIPWTAIHPDSGVLQRDWEEVDEEDEPPKNEEEDSLRFSVCCYNVLSPVLQDTHSYLYSQTTDPASLKWPYRKQLFFKEIQLYTPDIVCLQEVDAGLIHDYDEAFSALGYSSPGLFKQRTGDKGDGCSMYFHPSKFTLLDWTSVEYRQDASVPLMNRDNVAVLAKLETKDKDPKKKKRIVVATTHLLFNRKRNDVKIGQASILLAELDRLAFCGHQKDSGQATYLPTIVTGDFNVCPESPVAKFFTNGKLILNHELVPRRRWNEDPSSNHLLPLGITDQCQHFKLTRTRAELKTSSSSGGKINLEFHTEQSKYLVHLHNHQSHKKKKDMVLPDDVVLEEIAAKGGGGRVSFGGGELSHTFNFKDAYALSSSVSRPDEEGELIDEDYYKSIIKGPPVTTFQDRWVRVDYIFYSSKENEEDHGLRLIRRLKLPSPEEATASGRIPRLGVPSDHYSLLAEFSL